MSKKTLARLTDLAEPSIMEENEQVSTGGRQSRHVKDYTLNIEKSLAKKLTAAQRKEKVSYKFKDGGLVITTDAVTFERLKRATEQYFMNFPSTYGMPKIQNSTDSTKKNVVQSTIRVNKDGPVYTANLYYTTSRLLVNGKNVELFMTRDINSIHEIIQKVTSAEPDFNTDKLNRKLAQQLEDVLSCRNKINFKNNGNTIKTSKTVTQSIQCIKCKKNCKNRSTYCSTGAHWIHYRCERLTVGEIEALESEVDEQDYTCKLCITQPDSSTKISHSLAMPKINNHVTQEILNEEVGLDSSDDDCPVCCTTMNSDIDACDQCNMQIHRTCMSEIENVCMNCQMIDDQCDLE